MERVLTYSGGDGLAIFGYPISLLQSETVESPTLPVQWFERDRLEDHSPAMQSFEDTWSEGQPDTPPDTPPGPGLYAPYRGFGTTWSSNPPVRVGIGWATEPRAQAGTADIQLFDKVLLLSMNEIGVVYAFGNTNTSTDAQIIAP